MPKLTVLKGLPGSGKSTWALEELERNPNAIRVNRDTLRPMLHGNRNWTKERESATISAEMNIVSGALDYHDVVVDDTNLSKYDIERWEGVLEDCARRGKRESCEFHVKDFTNVPIADCIKRDATRTGSARVGRGVIERMALTSGLIDLSGLDKVAIIDIDGTLANLDHRLHYLTETPKNYAGFFRDLVVDLPFLQVWAAVHLLANAGHTIIMLSGRPTTTGHETADWLDAKEYQTEDLFAIPYRHLFMRQSGDHRPDDQVKRQLMEFMFKAGLKKDAIKVIIDDRDSVCAVWRELELPLIQVDHGSIVRVEPSAARMINVTGIGIKYASN